MNHAIRSDSFYAKVLIDNYAVLQLICLLFISFPIQATSLQELPEAGSKFHPGHYVYTEASRSQIPSERQIERLETINSLSGVDQLKGFVSHFEWKVLEPEKGIYKLEPIRQLLNALEGTGKYLGIYIRDRNFGKACGKPPVPKYLLSSEYGKPYKTRNNVCMIEIYNKSIMDRKLALYAAIAEQFDHHPNLQFITDGETTISGRDGFSNEHWLKMLKYYFTESKKHFKNTLVLVQTNFLGTGVDKMNELAEHMVQVGGGALGLPDTVPCRRTDIDLSEVCGYRIPGYDVLRRWRGKLAIAPSVETWDLAYDDTTQVLDMASQYLGATHVLWGRVFISRIDTEKFGSEAYLQEQVLPTIKANPNVLRVQCPESLAPCIFR